MQSFREKPGNLGSNGPVQEQMGAEFSQNSASTIAPEATVAEENLEATISDLQSHSKQEKEAIFTGRAGMSEEIKDVESEFNTTETLLKAEKKPVRASNRRRRKIRVYLT